MADRVLPRALRRRREYVRIQLGIGDVARLPDLPAQLHHRAAAPRHHRYRRKRRGPTADARSQPPFRRSTTSPARFATASGSTSAARRAQSTSGQLHMRSMSGISETPSGSGTPPTIPIATARSRSTSSRPGIPTALRPRRRQRCACSTSPATWRPIIVGQGTADPIVSAKEAPPMNSSSHSPATRTTPSAPTLSPDGSRRRRRAPFVDQALAALEDWITYRQTAGAAVPARTITGLEPLHAPSDWPTLAAHAMQVRRRAPVRGRCRDRQRAGRAVRPRSAPRSTGATAQRRAATVAGPPGPRESSPITST